MHHNYCLYVALGCKHFSVPLCRSLARRPRCQVSKASPSVSGPSIYTGTNIHSLLVSVAEDNDLDSSMLSTPSNEEEHDSDQNLYNEEEDQELFPSSDRPSTPKNNHLNATAPGELSPPQSKSTTQRVTTGADDTVEMGGMGNDGEATFNNVVNGIDGVGGMNGQQSGTGYVPGIGWKTKKANEEYQRAAETLVDRDFSLREFGDLFDDRAVAQQPASTGQE